MCATITTKCLYAFITSITNFNIFLGSSINFDRLSWGDSDCAKRGSAHFLTISAMASPNAFFIDYGGYADSAGAPSPGNARQFSVTSGDVTIAIIDGGTY